MSVLSSLSKTLYRFSPEVNDLVKQLRIESRVALVHHKSAKRCLKDQARKSGLKINLGSGVHTKKGFLNLDYSERADYRLDLRRKIPLGDKSCALIFSEHFVEHLSYPEGVGFLFADCFRILDAGGVIALSVPDTDWPLATYGKTDNEWIEASKKHSWHAAECTTYMEHLNFHFRQRWVGRSYGHFENHRFAWDFETMEKKLREAGFQDIRLRKFDPEMDSDHRKLGSLLVEARKP